MDGPGRWLLIDLQRMWDAEASSKAYPTREDFVRDCVPILRREIELLREEGVSIIQVDDPHLCLFVDPQVRAGYADPEQAADFAVDDPRPWGGLRPMTPDGRPCTGATSVPGLFTNTGHGMLGWTLACASAFDAAEAVVRSH